VTSPEDAPAEARRAERGSRWLPLEGAANARDVGGMPLAGGGGAVAARRLLRADNLQDLTPADVELLTGELGLRAVVDLRTGVELEGEGPGPLATEPRVRIEHRSLHPEWGGQTDVDAQSASGWGAAPHPEDAGEPPVVAAYLGYLRRRPDSVIAAVRAVAAPPGDGAVLVHCAAGMDRTGVVVALALDAAGVEREAVVADYAATGERIEGIIARLSASSTYASEVETHTLDEFRPRAESMDRFLALVDERHGGAAGWLREHGLTEAELAALRARLRDA